MGHINEKQFFAPYLDLLQPPYLEVGGRRIDEHSRFWRNALAGQGPYVSLDIQPDEGVDVVIPIDAPWDQLQDALLSDHHLGTYATVICCSVLQHVPRLWQAVSNLQQLLAPLGHFCLTVPFVWRYSGHPADYWRFTREGVRQLWPDLIWLADSYASSEPGELLPRPYGGKKLDALQGRACEPRWLFHAIGQKDSPPL